MHRPWGYALAGLAAGAVAGLFGAGGGMVLVPLLTLLTPTNGQEIFPASVSVILPICLVTLTATACFGSVPWLQALPYCIGGGLGGCAAGLWGWKIPARYLHRILGGMILWGGIRYLC